MLLQNVTQNVQQKSEITKNWCCCLKALPSLWNRILNVMVKAISRRGEKRVSLRKIEREKKMKTTRSISEF